MAYQRRGLRYYCFVLLPSPEYSLLNKIHDNIWYHGVYFLWPAFVQQRIIIQQSFTLSPTSKLHVVLLPIYCVYQANYHKTRVKYNGIAAICAIMVTRRETRKLPEVTSHSNLEIGQSVTTLECY